MQFIERFMKSPINVAIDRNYLDFNLTFPSFTICPIQRLDQSKVKEVLKGVHNQKRGTFEVFIYKLANFSKNSLKEVVNYRDVDPEKYSEVFKTVKKYIK